MTITVTCPSCSTVFPVDPAKVPEGGVNARCSVCSSVFFVDKPDVESASPATPPAPPPTPDVTAADARRQATVPTGEPVPPAQPARTGEVGSAQDPPETDEKSSPWIDTPSHVEVEDRMVPTLDEDEEEEDATVEPDDQVEVEPAEATDDVEAEPGEAVDEVEVEPAEPIGEPEVRETTADDFSPVGLGATEVVPDEEISPEDDPSAGVAPETAPDTSKEVQGFTFGQRDPHEKARRLARVLVSDMIMYNPERHVRALENHTLEDDFEDEIEKSWKEYVEQVGPEMASDTSYFTDALNEILAKGEPVFDARG